MTRFLLPNALVLSDAMDLISKIDKQSKTPDKLNSEQAIAKLASVKSDLDCTLANLETLLDVAQILHEDVQNLQADLESHQAAKAARG